MPEDKKVLIADDDAKLRKAMSIRLKEDGYKIIEANDGEAAYEKAIAEKPDLILLDVMMPKLTGQEVVQKLHKNSWGKSVPILFLTNVSDPIKVAEISEESVGNSTIFDYMVKSDWSLDDISARVKQKLDL